MKKIPLIIILFYICFYSFPDELVLKNGEIYKGQLIFISLDKLSIQTDQYVIDFPISIIDYFLPGNMQDLHTMLQVSLNEEIAMKVNLIKLTGDTLYYKEISGNKINSLPLKDILDMQALHPLEAVGRIIVKNINYQIDPDKDLDIVIGMLLKNKENVKDFAMPSKEELLSLSRSTAINIEAIDFYEKFWNRIERFIGNNTKNLVWDLLERYSEKEKFLGFILNEKGIIASGQGFIQNSENKSQVLAGINRKLVELRNDFYQRSRKIILESEILLEEQLVK
jgi:hypothetical protein